ncbi:hypothetical protein KKA66_01690, partial [Patescibacteria group bacterium]|nr:hypothetical protein [Patescibacteria group bacterium]
MNLQKTTYNLLKNNKSIFLIGNTNSGKTWFVKNNLIPFLQEKKMSVLYIQNCDNIPKLINKNYAIIDEIEILQDKDFLEKNNLNEKPYYNKEYLIKVKKWFDK